MGGSSAKLNLDIFGGFEALVLGGIRSCFLRCTERDREWFRSTKLQKLPKNIQEREPEPEAFCNEFEMGAGSQNVIKCKFSKSLFLSTYAQKKHFEHHGRSKSGQGYQRS